MSRPRASLSHLLTIDDQIAAWTSAHANLAPGGRFVVDLTMPNLAAYAESMHVRPRTLLEIDLDTRDPASQVRLLRCKTTRYIAHEHSAPRFASSTTGFQMGMGPIVSAQ